MWSFNAKLTRNLSTETRLTAVTVEQCGKTIEEYCKYSFSHTLISICVRTTLAAVPRAEEGSGLDIETNEKRIGKVSFLQNTSSHNFLMSW